MKKKTMSKLRELLLFFIRSEELIELVRHSLQNSKPIFNLQEAFAILDNNFKGFLTYSDVRNRI
jgi:hypothetical protein